MISPGGPGLELWLIDLAAGEPVLQALDDTHGLVPPVSTPAPSVTRAWPGDGRQRAARIALRALLAGHVGLDAARRPFEVSPAGKPSLIVETGRNTIDFSLAHCEAAALIAISGHGPVGVDLEAVRAVRINPERRAMLEAAAAALSVLEPLPGAVGDRRFLQAWVRLEALAKATGEGISALLGRLGVRGASLLAPVGAGQNGQHLHVRDLDLTPDPQLHAAVAGAMPQLGPDQPAPIVRQLPLDPSSLARLLA